MPPNPLSDPLLGIHLKMKGSSTATFGSFFGRGVSLPVVPLHPPRAAELMKVCRSGPRRAAQGKPNSGASG